MRDLEKKKYWIWLSLINGLGVIKKKKLLELYKTPEKIYKLTKRELSEVPGIGEKLADKILCKETRQNVKKHIEYMQRNSIDIINIDMESYPYLLREIYDAPISIYIKGNKEILNQKSVAIVGCREASEYGKKVAKYFAYNLAKEKVNIISGLAKGVDSYAHLGSICAENKSSRGKTIAVVGNGLDIVYPSQNKNLAQKIIESGGAIISEYPLGTKPDKMNFPARNRIISGISNGIIVVEAKEKSGTLITVDFALEQGRDVFAVPGNINSANSVGTNDLIKSGAMLATTHYDVLEKIGEL